MTKDGKSGYQGFWVFDTEKMAVVPYTLSHDELVAQATAKRNNLLSQADYQVQIFTDLNDPDLNDVLQMTINKA